MDIQIDEPSTFISTSWFLNRTAWSIINGFCFLWSFLLFLQIILSTDALERLEGTQEYMVWVIVTCTIWGIEAGLHACLQRGNAQYASIIELFFAAYFVVDSILWFQSSRQGDDDITGEIFDVGLSAVAYFYMFWITSDCSRRIAGSQEILQPEPYSSVETEANSPYMQIV